MTQFTDSTDNEFCEEFCEEFDEDCWILHINIDGVNYVCLEPFWSKEAALPYIEEAFSEFFGAGSS